MILFFIPYDDDNDDEVDEDVRQQQGRLFIRWRGRRAMANLAAEKESNGG